MVAYLQDGALDDERLTGKAPDHRVKGHSPENQQKWYYKDPQGEIQGESLHIVLFDAAALIIAPLQCLVMSW